MTITVSGLSITDLSGGPTSLNLNDLHDVSIVSPVSGNYLRYNSSISGWQNTFLNTDVYNYLTTNLTGSNGIVLTNFVGPEQVNISLSTTGASAGSYGSSTLVPVITVDAYGRVTNITNTVVSAGSSNIAGGTAGSIVYQSAPSTSTTLPAGTSSQVLVSGATPSWTNTPTLTGTNFTGIPNAGLTNSSLTIGSTNIALGATSTTLAGLSSVTSTSFVGALTGNASTVTNGIYSTDTGTVTNNMLAGSIANAKLLNSSLTIGSTSVSLGATSTTLAGLTSITSTTFVGALTGNASTATTAGTVTTAAQPSITSVGTLSVLAVTGTHTQTGALNLAGASSPLQVGGSAGTSGQVLTSAGAGVTPTWSAPAAGAAGTLTGTTLAANVVSSSLTSVGTITSGVWNGTSIANANLSNSALTIGSTSITLGTTATILAGLSSVTSGSFVGALTGNASTSTSATTATNIASGAAGSIPYQSAASTTSMLAAGTDGHVLTLVAGLPAWTATTGGTMTSVSVATANGLAGSSSGGNSPIITLNTTVTGILKGNGTTISAASSGDFPTLNQNTTGTASNVTGTVAVTNGGTGATTAATAPFALKGANTDITSLSSPAIGAATATTQIPGTNNTTVATTAFIEAAITAALAIQRGWDT